MKVVLKSKGPKLEGWLEGPLHRRKVIFLLLVVNNN